MEQRQNSEIHELLQITVRNKASDLHLINGVAPTLRIDSSLSPLTNYKPLTKEEIENMVFSLLTIEQKELLLANKELDFSIGFGEGIFGELGRFRVNAYFEKNSLSAAFRYLPPIISSIEQLHLPKICHEFAKLRQGFILLAGPTGHGKSTTLAAILQEINVSRPSHILTIEDPIEFVFPYGKSIISQREIGSDTHSWSMALRSALREDPDVVMIGEMRDPETIAAAITIAETGHLVFSTLHTNSAAQSIDRIIDSFSANQQPQIRIQLSATLKGIISQRLLPQISGGMIPATEIMLGTPAVANTIREGKTHLIDSVIQTSQDSGMITLESSLASLVLSGAISLETAKSYTFHEKELLQLIG